MMKVSLSSAAAHRRDCLGLDPEALPGDRDDERHVPVLLREVPQRRAHLDPRLAADPLQPRQRRYVLHIHRVHAPHVDLAQDPAEVPPAAGAVAVVGGRPPMGEVRVAAQRRDLHDERVASLAQVREQHLEWEVAGVERELLAVQPDLGAVVVALEAHLPEVARLLRRARQRELLAVPADRGAVLRGVLGVPVVGNRDRGPARQVLLVEPALLLADEGVVLAEVPRAAEQLAVRLALADQRRAAGPLDEQLGRDGRGSLGATGGRLATALCVGR